MPARRFRQRLFCWHRFLGWLACRCLWFRLACSRRLSGHRLADGCLRGLLFDWFRGSRFLLCFLLTHRLGHSDGRPADVWFDNKRLGSWLAIDDRLSVSRAFRARAWRRQRCFSGRSGCRLWTSRTMFFSGCLRRFGSSLGLLAGRCCGRLGGRQRFASLRRPALSLHSSLSTEP